MRYQFNIDHVGWITKDIEKFESFWCGVLGFEKKHESTLTVEMAEKLFGISSPAKIRRYFLRDMSVEIHCFDDPPPTPMGFDRYGINHVCFFVEQRDAFLSSLPKEVPVHVYDNPGGWKNIFITDFEGNWIELRTRIK